ncbi:hypothetical protein LJC40_05405 [Synergistaceae bacterium OttesenSCG-928-D05]|nr:hypothetical protein [Synergistaceae bacterium OttesenSCG-928-D05]
MIYLVRSGPEKLVIAFGKGFFEEAERTILKWGEYAGNDPEEVSTFAGEYCRVLIAIVPDEETGEERLRIYVSNKSHVTLFCQLLNGDAVSSILHCWREPGYIMMRLIGDAEAAIAKIKEDLNATYVNKKPFFRRTLPEDSTVVYFTAEPLNKIVPDEAMYDTALLVEGHTKEQIMSILRLRSGEYLSDSMGTPDWNGMEIQIGDKEKRFATHRRRIHVAVQGLQIGTIVEEGWKREYTLMGKVVKVYVLRLFTPLDAEEVKGFLSGLEYDANGERVADLDLFVNGEKISWKDKLTKEGLSKKELGLEARENMLAHLDPFSARQMRDLDDELKNEAISAG